MQQAQIQRFGLKVMTTVLCDIIVAYITCGLEVYLDLVLSLLQHFQCNHTTLPYYQVDDQLATKAKKQRLVKHQDALKIKEAGESPPFILRNTLYYTISLT